MAKREYWAVVDSFGVSRIICSSDRKPLNIFSVQGVDVEDYKDLGVDTGNKLD